MRKHDDQDFFGKFFGGFVIIWAISAIISVGFLGLIAWAIIELVAHFTS